MPEFYADWEQIIRYGNSMKDDTGRLRNLLYRASELNRNLGDIGSHKYLIQQAISKSNSKLEYSINKLRDFANTAISAGNMYRSTENKLMGRESTGSFLDNLTLPDFFRGGLIQTIRPVPPYPRRDWIRNWIGQINLAGLISSIGSLYNSEGISGTVSANGSIQSASAEYSLPGGAVDLSIFGSMISGSAEAGYHANIKDGLGAHASAEGSLLEAGGKLKIGDYTADGKVKVGTGAAKGKIGASLFKDGKLSPSIEAELKARVAAVDAEYNTRLGDNNNNVHSHADGSLLGAEAEASAKVGVIEYVDSDGVKRREIGAEAKVGADAYVAKGRASTGFTLFGVKVDVGVEGKLLDAGAYAGGKVTTGSVSGKVGAGLGLGAGVDFSIDWSGFSLDKLKFW